LPPTALTTIPVDRRPQSRFKADNRLPSEFAPHLGRIHCVSAIMAWAILHVRNQLLWLSEQSQNPFRHLHIRFFAVRAYVVDLSRTPLFQYIKQGSCMVLDMDPIADLLSIAVKRQRPILKR